MNQKCQLHKWESMKNHSPQISGWGQGVGWGKENICIIRSNFRNQKNSSGEKN